MRLEDSPPCGPEVDALDVPWTGRVERAERPLAVSGGQNKQEHDDERPEAREPSRARESKDHAERDEGADPCAPGVAPQERRREKREERQRSDPPAAIVDANENRGRHR